MFRLSQVSVILSGVAVLGACADQARSPTGLTSTIPGPGAALQARALNLDEPGASLRWNEIERNLLIKHQPNQNAAFRQFAYLSLAQYSAVIAAEDAEDEDNEGNGDNEDRSRHLSAQGAVAGASAAVLTYFYPDEQQFLDDQVRAQQAATPRHGERHTDFSAGETVGRAVGAQVVASAKTDRFDAVWTGMIPVCPGCWRSNSPTLPPLLPLLGEMRPFFMTVGNQFRPAPPPAFGSPEFLAALAEVRHFSDTRTAEQDRIAKFWAGGVGTSLVAGLWNTVTTDLIGRFHQDERNAAHTLALTNMAALDALIASHDAKYAYWLIRPTQADPLITLSIGLPNHPSYTSNHAAISTTIALILGSIFPSKRNRLAAMAEEAGLSRIYGGIHYRFDKTAGEEIARKLSGLALRLDVHPERPIEARVNLNVTLRGEGHAHGHITFRQPVDANLIVYLDTRVRGLAPNTSYLLQRAADGPGDGTCTSTSWLTLGKGLVPQAITTDNRGSGLELLFRILTSAVGTTFDIHFRVIDSATSAVVLQSGCYQFVVSQ
jgi:membrane-associated phospholipid phosphatase